jgi:Na+/proline symporter
MNPTHRVDPDQLAREQVLGRLISRLVIVIGLVALAGAVIPGTPGTVLGALAIIVVTAVPVLRVVWLVVIWRRQGDTRFVTLAVALLALMVVGTLLAVLRR